MTDRLRTYTEKVIEGYRFFQKIAPTFDADISQISEVREQLRVKGEKVLVDEFKVYAIGVASVRYADGGTHVIAGGSPDGAMPIRKFNGLPRMKKFEA